MLAERPKGACAKRLLVVETARRTSPQRLGAMRLILLAPLLLGGALAESSLPWVVSGRQRMILERELRYLPSEIQMMSPDVAAIVVRERLVRPASGMPASWRRDAGPGAKGLSQSRRRAADGAGGPRLNPVAALAKAVSTLVFLPANLIGSVVNALRSIVGGIVQRNIGKNVALMAVVAGVGYATVRGTEGGLPESLESGRSALRSLITALSTNAAALVPKQLPSLNREALSVPMKKLIKLRDSLRASCPSDSDAAWDAVQDAIDDLPRGKRDQRGGAATGEYGGKFAADLASIRARHRRMRSMTAMPAEIVEIGPERRKGPKDILDDAVALWRDLMEGGAL